jgi:hypothetical protein
MMEDKVATKMAGKGNIAGRDHGAQHGRGFGHEHIIIDYLGHRHCLLVLFMDLSKR